MTNRLAICKRVRHFLFIGGYNGRAPPGWVRDGLVTTGSVPPHRGTGGKGCDAHINKTIWTSDDSGAALQCRIPCEGIISDEMCDFEAGICRLLSDGFKTLSKVNLSIPLPLTVSIKLTGFNMSYQVIRSDLT